jgi:hypothetical protein
MDACTLAILGLSSAFALAAPLGAVFGFASPSRSSAAAFAGPNFKQSKTTQSDISHNRGWEYAAD